MTDEKKKDPRQIVLEDGQELTLDMRNITWVEANEMLRVRAEKEGDIEAAQRRFADLLGRCVSLSAEEVLALNLVDFARVSRRVAEFVRDPLGADPN
ncbi:MAG: hypothetical protein JXJ17_17120 [Anaerolineae bacterium]|nr:hypothetical protein [Anaerolineae bacterium]